MKKFLIKVAVFFVIVALIDMVAGKLFGSLAMRATNGDSGRSNFITFKTNQDVLILGSSRAYHHYNPKIFSDSLGISCYNCGQDGNGSILNYARFQLICQRYHPKVVIYDVIPDFDYLAVDDNHKYLGWLKPFYDEKGVADVFEMVDETEKYKMMSQMYRYNSKFMQIITDNIHAMHDEALNGFDALEGEMDTIQSRVRPEPIPIVYDFKKMLLFSRLPYVSKDTKFVYVVSPYWDGRDTAPWAFAKAYCQERGIPFLDYSNDPKYVHHDIYFKDGAHLNDRGADEFTRDVITELIRRGILTKP